MPSSSMIPQAEIAHILFMDMVGHSLRSFEAQSRAVADLTRLVRESPEFQRAEAAGELRVFPTGDGMALAFFRYPLAPVQCALEIARAAAAHPALPLRMGIHSGPVSTVTDAAGHANLTGSGINLGQRVMDCGDTGHILLSAPVAEVLLQFDAWRGSLRDLGEQTVKHGERLHLYSLCHEGLGNPARPKKLPASAIVTASIPTVPEKSVALLYKRNAPHSPHLLDLLEKGLKAAGYPVFIDSHLRAGVDWAHELRRQVRSAYAVVPLLSAESIWSEMVEEEVQTAYEAAQTQQGLPRLLPVRVAYEGPLPDTFAHILDPLQYILWRGPEDDDLLVRNLLDALNHPPRPAADAVVLEPVGGAVPLDSRYYIERPTDAEFSQALARRDSILLVKGARQMGKTSLLTRGLQQARATGARGFRTDFQKLSAAVLSSEETFYRTLMEIIADQSDRDDLPEVPWNATRNGAFNFERFLRREILMKSEVPVVWALDEVDKLFACPFGSDVFALFRSWHNDRSYEPDGPWSKLTMVIAYATEAHLFITDINQSPFNVGTRLTLSDFNREQVGELNRRYGSPLHTEEEVGRFHLLTGGQPYLCRRGLDHLAQHPIPLDALEEEADRDEGFFGDHLRRLLVMLSQDEETLRVVRGLLRGEPLPNAAIFYRLRSGGLLSGSSEHDAHLRCHLYSTYLRRHLL